MTARLLITAIGLLSLGSSSLAQAQTVGEDPLKQGRVLELSFGLFAPQNTLQDTLTVLNGAGPQVQSTDILDFGRGGRFALDYSQPWGGSRLLVNLTGATATGETDVLIGGSSEAFPGSHDDGYNLPAGWTAVSDVETRQALLMVGREWGIGNGWNASFGVQGGRASQDFSALIQWPDATPVRTVSGQSNNRMLGLFGGASHYSALGQSLGLRLSATIGVMRNSFDYTYENVQSDGIVADTFDQSDNGTAVSTKVSARLERSLSATGVLSLEIGYEGLSGIGNGADTFLDPDGTDSSADINSDRIGAGYLSLAYAFRF